MKQLPYGIQTFSKIIEQNGLYIDKTKDIYNLINKIESYYFISRPRRFGKSLLISTLEEIFLGNKELFKEFFIYDKIDWTEHPVIKIDFSSISYMTPEKLEKSLNKRIIKIASEYNFELDNNNDYKDSFKELIEKLSINNKVVILIDEYDKPIIDFVDEPEIATQNRNTLKYFYETIKACDKYIRFVFLTGVSKFSKVSVFSGLNNLEDITLSKKYSNMLGYTEEELYSYFSNYIESLANKNNMSIDQMKYEIKRWYNGYSWDGENFVYNPFSILALFSNLDFNNYWFTSGTPSFLIKQIRKYNTNIEELEHFEAISSMFEAFDINKMDVHSLLFQTGYLTIKEIKELSLGQKEYILSYPNIEVKESLVRHILGDFTTDTNK